MSVLNNNYDVLFDWINEDNVSFLDILKKSKKNLVYFYPKNDTPWCIKENVWFNEEKTKFLSAWIQIIWISKDSIESHKKFACKYGLTNILVSDTNLELHKYFWAYWEKNNYWKIVLWVIRSTFLLDDNWNIIKEFKNVKATGHHLKMLKELVWE